jgi:hypothetical protein
MGDKSDSGELLLVKFGKLEGLIEALSKSQASALQNLATQVVALNSRMNSYEHQLKETKEFARQSRETLSSHTHHDESNFRAIADRLDDIGRKNNDGLIETQKQTPIITNVQDSLQKNSKLLAVLMIISTILGNTAAQFANTLIRGNSYNETTLQAPPPKPSK